MENLDASPFYSEAFTARAATGLSTANAAKVLKVKSSQMKKWEDNKDLIPADKLAELRALAPTRVQNQANFRFIDLFAGIGGLRRAFEAAGGECVFTSEWNKEALNTYLANFGEGHPVAGDITKVLGSEIPNHDILVGGFPCQPFSLSGVSKKNSMGRPHGFADETQGTLFFDVARLIAAKRPAAFLLENVRNLVSHDKGNTFEVIKRTLQDELGYSISWRVMEAKPWVPQKRPRIVIVGFRDGQTFDFDSIEVPAGEQKLASILHRAGEKSGDGDRYTAEGLPHAKYTKSDKLWSYLQAHAAKHAAKGNGFGFGLHGADDVARTLSARYGKDGAEILIRQDGKNPRQLTPRECARLMGFDMPGSSEMIIPVSDAQAYKQFGNSVVVPMFAAVAQAMVPLLGVNQKTALIAAE